MNKKFCYKLLLALTFVCQLNGSQLIWNVDSQGTIWSTGCDFETIELSKSQLAVENCPAMCVVTPECTHFSWSIFNGGTCFMKAGGVSKADAFTTSDSSSLCGIVPFGQSPDDLKISWKIDSQGINWASNCEFRTTYLTHERGPSEQCGSFCVQTPGCTHFSWNSYHDGTCWMKSGFVSKEDAVLSTDSSSVCGIIPSIIPNSDTSANTNVIPNVMATKIKSKEIGTCNLPFEIYSVEYPIGLGDISSLSYLKFNSSLCGHVLELDCGYGWLDVIVTNSNYGGGLNLYASTWKVATNNLNQDLAYCSVRLSSKNPFISKDFICYHATDDTLDDYYHKIGLFNTNEKLVTRAVLNGVEGEKDPFSPYFVFNIFGTYEQQVEFFFDDGFSFTTELGSCLKSISRPTWS